MTGTGTQADPFFPTNWSEFLAAVGTENAYVECPADEEWDMNEINPNGITSTISWKATQVEGNNLKIKNLVFKAGISSSKKTTVQHLNFLNMSDLYYQNIVFSNGVTWGFVFKNCDFTGQFSQATLFKNALLTHDGVKSCTLSFNFINTGKLGSYVHFDGCKLDLSGKNDEAVSSVKVVNCYFMGTLPFKSLVIYNTGGGGTGNVFDIFVPEGSHLNGNFSEFVGVFNSDKMSGTYKVDIYKPVTTAQLTDIAYLQSIGFPAV